MGGRRGQRVGGERVVVRGHCQGDRKRVGAVDDIGDDAPEDGEQVVIAVSSRRRSRRRWLRSCRCLLFIVEGDRNRKAVASRNEDDIALLGLLTGLLLGFFSVDGCFWKLARSIIYAVIGIVFGVLLGPFVVSEYFAITRGWIWLLPGGALLGGCIALLVCWWLAALHYRTYETAFPDSNDSGQFMLGAAGAMIGVLAGSVVGCALSYGSSQSLPAILGALAGLVALAVLGALVGWLLGPKVASGFK